MNKSKQTISSILAIIAVTLIFILLENSIENQARQQNTFNLDSINHCVHNEMQHHENTSATLTRSLNSCAKNIRSTGITGDVFVIRYSDKKLFWDASVDCKPDEETKMFMTEDGICSLFKKPETCVKATEFMLTNPPKGTLTWEFDDSIEYVDYMYLDIDIKGETYIIGQGSQRDEAHKLFNGLFAMIFITGLVLVGVLNF